MGIESIGSVTAMQVQSTVKAQPVETKSADVNKEVAMATDSAVPQIDVSTVAVAKTAEGNAENNQQSNKQKNEQIRKAVEQMNKQMKNSEAVFGIHEGTNRVTIKIVNKETDEVIKELPPEKTLDMIARVWEMAGILVDEKR